MPYCGLPDGTSLWSMWNIPLLLAVLATGWLYFVSWRRSEGKDRSGANIVGMGKTGKMISFYSGLALFYLFGGSPLYYLGHMYLFSVHMTTMAIQYIVVPPLVLLGLADWMVRPLMDFRRFRAFFRLMSQPLFALTMFNLLFSAYHVPYVFDYIMDHEVAAFIADVLLMITAFSNWLPIIHPLPEMNRMGELQKILYLFLDAILLTPACAFLIFSNGPLYGSYVMMPRLIPALSVYVDQQLGGIIMKLTQEMAYIGAIGYIFWVWVRKERKRDEQEKAEVLLFPVDKDDGHRAHPW
ncbi:MAG: cytochrome c oxidase assembly protein [Alicyclobacillaceae bacterium]|nr:cytochrome c oxidase assembly protein [Alicyclobacillaceae bacterium]